MAKEPKGTLLVIDADGVVLGRAATHIAKALLSSADTRVAVINAEKALITGSPKGIEARYHQRRTVGKERRGPFYPSRPERIFKRAVRGMLPFKQDRGREAYKRLKCYNGVPREFAGVKAERPKHATTVRTARYITLAQVAQSIGGWKPAH
ncbi:MAG TPA: 50S ribosomal protein L13 [Candidatus Thermoplasmatota archaeon]